MVDMNSARGGELSRSWAEEDSLIDWLLCGARGRRVGAENEKAAGQAFRIR
jgi:hypothetical protein